MAAPIRVPMGTTDLSMFALYFLLVLAVYLTAVLWLAKRLSRWWQRITAVVIAALIPTWDMIAQSIAVSDVCKEVAPVFHETPRSVEGFAQRTDSLRYARELVNSGRYRFVEIALLENEFVRVERLPDGSTTESPVDELMSRYLVDSKIKERPFGIIEIVAYVLDRNSDIILVEQRRFMRAPTWMIRAVFRDLARNGDVCTAEADSHIHLVSEFLMSMESNE